MSAFRNMLAAAVTLILLTGTVTGVQAADPLKIGLMEDVSGDLAFMGMPKLHGSQLAVEEINKAGGILGRQIELIHLDQQGDTGEDDHDVAPGRVAVPVPQPEPDEEHDHAEEVRAAHTRSIPSMSSASSAKTPRPRAMAIRSM